MKTADQMIDTIDRIIMLRSVMELDISTLEDIKMFIREKSEE